MPNTRVNTNALFAKVQLVGYCTPSAILGALLTSIGGGLLTTLDGFSGAGSWIGYQILVGLGRAPGVQMVRSLFL